jgi:hypothetical protein
MTSAETREQRRTHLIALMGQHRVSCPQVAEMMDRKPHTVRCWRSGVNPINDHTLLLLELLLLDRPAVKQIEAPLPWWVAA